jgi:predicted RNA binding protein YcfA (HicA-like mRNA interferase family)
VLGRRPVIAPGQRRTKTPSSASGAVPQLADIAAPSRKSPWASIRPTFPVGWRAGVAHAHAFLDGFSQDVYFYTPMKSRSIIALKEAGWVEVAQAGSHVQFKHPTKPGRVTVPHPTRDFPVGTLRSIEKQSGLKLR